MKSKARDTRRRDQDSTPAKRSGSRCTSRAGKPLVPAASLRGLPVRNDDGHNLGVLKDLMIETDRGTVAYAVLLFEDDKSFAVPYNALEITPDGKSIHVDIQREVFEQGRGMGHIAKEDPD